MSLLLAVLVAVGTALPVVPARAQQEMRPLEDALGDSLEVRRDGAPRTGDEGAEDASPGDAEEPSSSDSDGVREPVPPAEEPADDAAQDDREPSPRDGDVPVELHDADEGVEGEGRGGGELGSGLPARGLPIVLAVLAVIGAATAVVLTQRRWQRAGA